ncbi:MAG: NifB/NifX family molybdenum-iron cluster-binding protein [Dehalococcoidia bacterium]|nr:NifB/NifX family molybdenum-iron cluster-binding protein [Dehalococcoidia bacterium]
MRVAISSTGPGLDAEVDPRFGRCRYFIIADPETEEFETVENSSAMAGGGAGISAAQEIVDRGVQAVLTGNCGPNAYQVLSSAGIQVLTGVSGTVKNAIEGYRSGKFKASSRANVPDHFGMGDTSGMVGGSGMGRGMGMGGGMGRGMGMGGGMRGRTRMGSPVDPAPQPESREEGLRALKAQSQAMAQQLAEIQRRIDEMESK